MSAWRSAGLPRVSVIMPARNASATLEAAVGSIRVQSFEGWELLIVDDGSTDSTADLAEAFVHQDSRIHLYRQPHRGIVNALEKGLQAARGEFIARMDSDDHSHPERLAVQVEFLQTRPEIGIVGSLVAFGGDREAHKGYSLHVEWLNSIVTPQEHALNRFIDAPAAHPSVLFRRSLLRQLGGYRDGPFPEDYELWLRWLDAGIGMAKVPRCLLTWNDSPDRLSRTHPRYDAEAFFAVKAGYLARAVSATRGNRDIWVWGAGRLARRRAELLTRHGIAICGYVDVDPRKCGHSIRGRAVVTPDEMPGPARALVVAYVAKRGAREDIRARLALRGFREGRDFWVAA